MSGMSLVGIHAKLRRVEQQIQKITYEADTLCEEVQQGIVREVRDDTDEQVWVYRSKNPEEPVIWSILVGEILYNLRSALDHLVWQLVLANGQTPGRHNEFLIAIDHQRWLQGKGRTLTGVSPKHQAMISYLQPFTGGINLPFNVSNLKVLDDLSNIEKHRHLIVAVIASDGIGPTTFEDNQLELGDLDARTPLKGTVYLAKIEVGKVLARFNNKDTSLNPSFKVDIRFAGEAQQWTMGPPVPIVLSECLDTVKGTVEVLTRDG